MEKRGLKVHSSKLFYKLLRHLGFNLFDDYCDAFLVSRSDQFRNRVTITDVYQIITFDEQLSKVLSFWLLKVEKAVRAGWIEYMARRDIYGSPFAYLDPQYYRKREFHKALITNLQKAWFSSNEPNVQIFRAKYCEQNLPPVWYLTPILTFGSLSKWISALNIDVQRDLYATMGLPDHTKFAQTGLHSLVLARNQCAHGKRIWNKRFPVSFVTEPDLSRQYEYKVRALLELLELVISGLKLNEDKFAKDLSTVFARLPKWQKPYMGWKLTEPIKWTLV